MLSGEACNRSVAVHGRHPDSKTIWRYPTYCLSPIDSCSSLVTSLLMLAICLVCTFIPSNQRLHIHQARAICASISSLWITKRSPILRRKRGTDNSDAQSEPPLVLAIKENCFFSSRTESHLVASAMISEYCHWHGRRERVGLINFTLSLFLQRENSLLSTEVIHESIEIAVHFQMR